MFFFFLQKGQTPLHYAAQNDHSQVVAVFLEHKPDVMMQQNAVSSVLATGSPRLTNKFVVHDLYLSVFRLQEGSTCVHIAAMKGSVAVIKELLKCNPSGITTARNKVILMETSCI